MRTPAALTPPATLGPGGGCRVENRAEKYSSSGSIFTQENKQTRNESLEFQLMMIFLPLIEKKRNLFRFGGNRKKA